MRIFFSCLLFYFMVLVPVWAIDAGNATWQVFTYREQIRALTADRDSLWVGSTGGLEQRDLNSGQLLRVFTRLDGLPDNRVTALTADKAGNLWAGTETGGLAHYSADRQWSIFDNRNSGLPDNWINGVEVDAQGRLWIATDSGGLARLDNDGAWRVYNRGNSALPADLVYAVYAADNDEIWAGTGGGLARLGNDGQWTVFDRDSGLAGNHVLSVRPDGAGGLWLANGVLVHRSAEGEFKIYDAAAGLPHESVNEIYPDTDGGVWVATWGGGLAYRAANGIWSTYNQADGTLPVDDVWTVYVDADGRMWAGTGSWRAGGLVQRGHGGTWSVFRGGGIPDNRFFSSFSDTKGGLWLGTGAGLGHYSATGEWTVYHTGNSGLPDNEVRAVQPDGQGGVWAGTLWGGLARLHANGEWSVYTTADSDLPVNDITALATATDGGLWIGTQGGGLVYRSANGQWQVYNEQSGLPGNDVRAVQPDGQGGVWIGMYGEGGGLAHLDEDGQWEVYNRSMSSFQFPDDNVWALALDQHGGVWAGTGELGMESGTHTGGLVHRAGDGTWTSYTQADSGLPDNWVTALHLDADGGVWAGTEGGGLAYRGADGLWTVFNTANSGLPDNWVSSLAPAPGGGVWSASSGVLQSGGALARLQFSRKALLAETVTDPGVAEATAAQPRAVILIHAQGAGGREQERATTFLAEYAYQTLQMRGYDHDEIYCVSFQPELNINADEQVDGNAVDAPLTLAELRAGGKRRTLVASDLEQAFAWAARRGSLNQPLLVLYVGEGKPAGLWLARNKELPAAELRRLLDEYQDASHNNVVLVMEASYSGSLLPALAAPGRLLVAATTPSGLALYEDRGRGSFLKYFLDHLRRGEDFVHALEAVAEHFRGHPLFRRQRPQADAETPDKVCLNGCWGGLPGELTLTVETPGGTVEPGIGVDLQVRTQARDTSVSGVWASVLTPRIAAQRDAHGFSRLPAPVVNLRRDSGGRWRGSFNEFQDQGDYMLTIKARDHEGFVTEAAPLQFTVADGQVLQAPRFDAGSGILDLPAVSVADGQGGVVIYQGSMQIDYPSLALDLLPASLVPAGNPADKVWSSFDPFSGVLHIPQFEFVTPEGVTHYGANLLFSGAGLRFTIDLDSFLR